MGSIVLIGASGFVGSAILNEALNRGYSVKAVVRNPENVKVSNEKLELVKADVTDVEAFSKVVKGCDAVISAYSPGRSNPNIYDDTLIGYRAILDAVKKAGVSRLQIVGGAGTLLVAPGVTVLQAGFIPDEIKPAVESIAKVYSDYLLPEKDLDWAFFSPAGAIEAGERTGQYRLGKDHLIMDDKGNSRISVEDYAKAMLDELEAPQHHRERFTIGY